MVHAATYAMLLLNTDLHIADVVSRMSRTDFVSNTMSAVRAQKNPQHNGGDQTPSSFLTPTMDSPNGYFDDKDAPPTIGRRSSMEKWRDAMGNSSRSRSKRSGSSSNNSSRVGLNDLTNFGASSSNLVMQSPAKDRLVASVPDSSISSTSTRAWEQEVESVLKDIYAAVRAKPIMQPLEYSSISPLEAKSASNSHSPHSTWTTISRSPSKRSQGSLGTSGNTAYKRASIRGFLNTGHETSRAASPTPSVATSASGGFSGSTSQSSSIATSFYPQSMGFASNLTQTIIREQQEEDAHSEMSDTSATDEELALLGAPWAKEGMLQQKHYWEVTGKRAKDKSWLQVFAVIQKGDMKMFQFGGSSLASGHGGLGGGNWLVWHLPPLPHNLSIILLIDLTDKCACHRRNHTSPIIMFCDAPSRLQPSKTTCIGIDHAEWRKLFLSGWHRGSRQRVGTNMQLLGWSYKQRATHGWAFQHGSWLEQSTSRWRGGWAGWRAGGSR